jgi:hypothetical protein
MSGALLSRTGAEKQEADDRHEYLDYFHNNQSSRAAAFADVRGNPEGRGSDYDSRVGA